MKVVILNFLLIFPLFCIGIETIAGNERIDGTIHIDQVEDVDIPVDLPIFDIFFSSVEFEYEAVLTAAQRKDFEQKINYHRSEGQKFFNEANKICILIPNVSDRKVAEDLFAAAIASSTANKKSWSAIVSGLTVLLVQYGCAVLAEYNRMNDLLLKSKYNFEMMEFYQGALVKG